MKDTELNSLEKFINKEQLTLMNERTIFQDDIISGPANEKYKKPSGNELLKAKGNAQLIDFIKYIGLIIETVFEDDKIQFLPYEKSFALKEDADKRLMNPIIAYRIMDRRYKEGSSYTPKVRDTVVDDTGRTGELYSEQFKSLVQFQIICMEYNKAWDIMNKFEELMIQYRSFLRERGIVNYYFYNQDKDNYCQDFLEIASILTLNYYVETEKNRVIFKENINNIRIRGEAKDLEGKPISSTGN